MNFLSFSSGSPKFYLGHVKLTHWQGLVTISQNLTTSLVDSWSSVTKTRTDFMITLCMHETGVLQRPFSAILCRAKFRELSSQKKTNPKNRRVHHLE